MSAWTAEQEAALTLLWNEGKLSAAVIAERLGLSKNAVIGKANRMGLQPKAIAPQRRAYARGPWWRPAGGIGIALALLIVMPAACAPIAWQPPPGAPPQALAMDDAACRLTARGMEGPMPRGLVWIAAHVAAERADYRLCMQARGYAQAAAP